jgi:nucleotide-binding universal stress UspA family protein
MNDWDIKTIVLGYDGSEGANRAVDLASHVARQNNARILVVNAYELGSPDTDGYKWGRLRDEAQDVAQEAVSRLQAAGVEAEPEVLDGPAETALLQVAESHDADLIVVGRRGHGLIAELLLGSTSEYVVRRAKVPVLVAH